MSRRVRFAGVGLAAVVAMALGVVASHAQQQQQSTAPAQGQEGTGYGPRAQAFIAAFNKGDAKAVAAFWTPEGDYTDQAGHKYKGRAALEKLYSRVFAERKGAKLKIIVTSLRLVTADVAIEEGITEVTPGEGGLPTAAKFTAVLVKKDGQWYFESVHDAVAQPPSNADHFEDLQWVLGDWAGEETKGESFRCGFAWAENKNFIVCSFATTLSGVPVLGGTQWICWDATEKKIRSFSFYSGGGIGEGVWSNTGKTWQIKTTAKSADGKRISATNTITQIDADTMTWQMTEVLVDGKAMPDAPATKLKRVKASR